MTQNHTFANLAVACTGILLAYSCCLPPCAQAQGAAHGIEQIGAAKNPSPAPPPAPPPATASCKAVADRYRGIAEHHPLDTPLAALAAPGSGITLVDPVATMASPAGMAAWAQAQQPPFTIPPELTQLLDFKSGAIEQLPGTNFYSVSGERGASHCIDSVYFMVADGSAQPVAPPPGFEDDGTACGVRRSYGTIDNIPALFEERYDTSPSMKSSIKVATWGTDRFAAACKVTFSFAARVTYRTVKDWGDTCTAYECEAMKTAAYQLVRAVQKDPATAQRQLLDDLSPEQKQQYIAAIGDGGDSAAGGTEAAAGSAAAAAGSTEAAADPDPATLTEDSPLRVPYFSWGHLYVVSLYHFTIGSQYFADWRIVFEQIEEDGRLAPAAAVSAGMDKGAVADVSITSLMPGN